MFSHVPFIYTIATSVVRDLFCIAFFIYTTNAVSGFFSHVPFVYTTNAVGDLFSHVPFILLTLLLQWEISLVIPPLFTL